MYKILLFLTYNGNIKTFCIKFQQCTKVLELDLAYCKLHFAIHPKNNLHVLIESIVNCLIENILHILHINIFFLNLQIQEINYFTGNATIFKKSCGEKEFHLTSKEPRLWIEFFSKDDNFTSKGFELILEGKHDLFISRTKDYVRYSAFFAPKI